MGKLLLMGQALGFYLAYRILSQYPTATIMKYGLPIAASAVIINATREKTIGEKLIARVF
jgi:hypothetical protein